MCTTRPLHILCTGAGRPQRNDRRSSIRAEVSRRWTVCDPSAPLSPENLAAAHAGGADALNEGLLGEKEERDDGHHEQRRCGHEQVPFAAAELRLVLLEAEGHGEGF